MVRPIFNSDRGAWQVDGREPHCHSCHDDHERGFQNWDQFYESDKPEDKCCCCAQFLLWEKAKKGGE